MSEIDGLGSNVHVMPIATDNVDENPPVEVQPTQATPPAEASSADGIELSDFMADLDAEEGRPTVASASIEGTNDFTPEDLFNLLRGLPKEELIELIEATDAAELSGLLDDPKIADLIKLLITIMPVEELLGLLNKRGMLPEDIFLKLPDPSAGNAPVRSTDTDNHAGGRNDDSDGQNDNRRNGSGDKGTGDAR